MFRCSPVYKLLRAAGIVALLVLRPGTVLVTTDAAILPQTTGTQLQVIDSIAPDNQDINQ